MASVSCLCLSKQQLIGILLIITFFSSSNAKGCYKSIISFGDSLADTGNWIILLQENKPTPAFPPFGGTYFNRPTGRCCDGRLIVDFFGTASLELQLVFGNMILDMLDGWIMIFLSVCLFVVDL